MQKYVWRKYIEYEEIEDVNQIKRKIKENKGKGDIEVRGNNVKIGRGGIREIEFFVKKKKLIEGGRFKEMRGKKNVKMMERIEERGWIKKKERDEMEKEYWFIRDVEKSIKMIEEEKKNIMNEDDEGFERV